MSQLLIGLLLLLFQATTPSEGTGSADAVAEQPAAAVETTTDESTPAVVESAEEGVIPAASTGTSNFAIAVTFFCVLVLPFILAVVIAKGLKVEEWTSRIAVVMFTLAIGASPFLLALLNGTPLGDRFRLGIDLAGGTNMVFQVEPGGKELTDALMSKMVDAVSQRINKSGTEEITVRQVGADRIEVIVPGEDPQAVEEIKKGITRLGSLEFFICADESDGATVRDALKLDKSEKVLLEGTEVIARWVPATEKNGVPQLLGTGISRKVEKIREVDGKQEKYETEEYLLLVGDPEEQITGDFLRNAETTIDPSGEIVVSFLFDTNGGYRFGRLTGSNLPQPGRDPRKLAIVLDGMVFSAPNINSKIDMRGQIEGGGSGFTREEADDLTAVLNAGALAVPINPKPLSEATVDPTLGADVRNKGVRATLISGLVVIVFMLGFYRFAGTVAVVSLMLNLLLTIAAMVAIGATFTLPGIAGIVLTIGMAVDANVLIYERMREEIAKGSSVRMAIQNGFEKAFITIFDANITTLLTAIILFWIGTDQIKGFAVTLFLGLAISMYTVLFVGRLLFDIAEKKRWLRQIKMGKLIGETRLDFLKHRLLWCGVSIAVISIGLIAFFVRFDKVFDIDFTGGTMVSFQTTEPQKTDDVTAALKEEFGDEFTLERLTIGQEKEEGVGTYFRLRSTEKDSHTVSDESDGAAGEVVSAEQRVREMVFKAFDGHDSIKLRMVSLSTGEVTPFTIAAGDESAEAILLKRFDGGSSSELTFSEEVAAGTVNDLLASKLAQIKVGETSKYPTAADLFQVQGLEGSGTSAGTFSVRKYNKFIARVSPEVSPADFQTALDAMSQTLASAPLFDEVNTFASAVASEMKERAVIAILVSILAISAYIWFRFQNVVFGIAAVAALVHDVLVALGFVALSGWISGTPIGEMLLIDDFRINLAMIAAFLTLVGYSLNDTIVIFDRIREVRGKNPAITAQMVNLSLNQTLGRTLLTATTVFLVVFIMYAFGGAGIHGFAWCLLIGCIAGTYSSIYVASPILVWALERLQGTEKTHTV
jgi:SecD/SecF fusion protein